MNNNQLRFEVQTSRCGSGARHACLDTPALADVRRQRSCGGLLKPGRISTAASRAGVDATDRRDAAFLAASGTRTCRLARWA